MTPDQLRAKAAEHDAAGERAVEVGDARLAAREFERAELYREVAAEMERLPRAKRSANVDAVTSAQLRDRGLAIARSRAKRDPFKRALVERGWSLRRYAAHLSISPAQLVNYRSGAHPIPRKLAETAARELGVPATTDTWPAGLAD